MPIKKLSEFTSGVKLKQKYKEHFSHINFKVKKKQPEHVILATILEDAPLPKKFTYNWFMKEASLPELAFREVIGQQLFRFFIPGQPKFYLGEEDNNPENVYVFSKEVTNSESLEEVLEISIKHEMVRFIIQNLLNGKYFGLGRITTLAKILKEIDLKNENILINKQNGQMIKIDGNWLFAKLEPEYKNKNLELTENEIKALPFIDNYEAFNWLDVRYEDKTVDSNLYDPEICNVSHIRTEINETLLATLIVPNEMIKEFIFSYLPEPNHPLYDVYHAEALNIFDEWIKSSIQQLSAVSGNQSFWDYVQTEAAAKYMNQFADHLENLTTSKKNYIKNKTPNFRADMENNFHWLRDKLKSAFFDREKLSELNAMMIESNKILENNPCQETWDNDLFSFNRDQDIFSRLGELPKLYSNSPLHFFAKSADLEERSPKRIKTEKSVASLKN